MSYAGPPPPDAGGYGGYARPRTNQKAVWALVLGILSILCCGLFAGIPALVLGNGAKKDIAASGGAETGSGMAQAGVVLGIISLALTALYVILLVTGVLTFPSGNTSP